MKISAIKNIAASAFLINMGMLSAQKIQDSLQVRDIEAVRISKSNPNQKHNIGITYSDLLNHDAGQFLSVIPEISGIKKAGNYATDPVLRGFKYEQLNIVIDGAAYAINACPSRMDPSISQINLNEVKEAEIIKGPYNFRYGTAFGGTINFVTVPPVFTDKVKLNARISTGYESNGSIFRNEVFTQLHSRKWAWDLFGSYQTGDDYKDGNGNTVDSGFKRYNVGTKGSFRWNDRNITTVHVNTNQGRDVDFAALTMDLIYDKTWMFQLGHKAKFLNSVLKHIDFNSYFTTVSHSMGTPSGSMVSDVKSSTYGGRMETKFGWNSNVFYSGVDFKHEEAKNTYMYMSMMSMMNNGTSWQDSEINQVGWFNEYNHHFSHSKFTASYRLDFNSGKANDPSEFFTNMYGSTQKKQVNNSFNIGYTQYLSENAKLSILAGRAQRSASLTERFINRFVTGNDSYQVLGNPDLKSETNNQADLVFTYRKENLYFQTDVFYSYIQNYISGVIREDINATSSSSPGVRQMQNIGNAIKAGFESRVNWKFLPHYRTELAIAYTYGENRKSKSPLPEIAPFSLRWNAEAKFSNFNAGMVYRFNAKQNRISEEFGELKTSDWSVFDVYAKYQINKHIHMSFEVSNLLNRNYSNYLSRTVSGSTTERITERGRSFNVGVNILL